MKLIIQIPCYNEEQTLPQTVRDLPRRIDGIDAVEILIIDDGSMDRTVETAKSLGIDHIVRNTCNQGLSRSFLKGLDACLRLGADIIVNTDGDNQYQGADIVKLVAPILRGEADVVIGDRGTDQVAHFSFIKKKLQKLGSWAVRKLSYTEVPDAVSGFRAFSRRAAMQINIVSEYSYTIESIIQAGNKKMAIAAVPVRTNPKTRESRLVKSNFRFVVLQLITMLRMYAMYRPLKLFVILGAACIFSGLFPSVRFLYYYAINQGAGHIQSLLMSAVLYIVGFQFLILGLLGDLISQNRRLIEETLLRVKTIEIERGAESGGNSESPR